MQVAHLQNGAYPSTSAKFPLTYSSLIFAANADLSNSMRVPVYFGSSNWRKQNGSKLKVGTLVADMEAKNAKWGLRKWCATGSAAPHRLWKETRDCHHSCITRDRGEAYMCAVSWRYVCSVNSHFFYPRTSTLLRTVRSYYLSTSSWSKHDDDAFSVGFGFPCTPSVRS